MPRHGPPAERVADDRVVPSVGFGAQAGAAVLDPYVEVAAEPGAEPLDVQVDGDPVTHRPHARRVTYGSVHRVTLSASR